MGSRIWHIVLSGHKEGGRCSERNHGIVGTERKGKNGGGVVAGEGRHLT